MGSRELLLDIDPPELKFHCKPVPPLPFLAYFAGSFCVVATRLGLSDDHVAFKVVVDLGFGFRFLFHSFLATSCETFVSARILCFYYCHDRSKQQARRSTVLGPVLGSSYPDPRVMSLVR
ncbi:hypothetical protein GW17_00002516 [Ensete ventricosum]|nr:hypothetical protein GW17_00002516 [Ensete ventricosum]